MTTKQVAFIEFSWTNRTTIRKILYPRNPPFVTTTIKHRIKIISASALCSMQIEEAQRMLHKFKYVVLNMFWFSKSKTPFKRRIIGSLLLDDRVLDHLLCPYFNYDKVSWALLTPLTERDIEHPSGYNPVPDTCLQPKKAPLTVCARVGKALEKYRRDPLCEFDIQMPCYTSSLIQIFQYSIGSPFIGI
jgi:hypothetical protein